MTESIKAEAPERLGRLTKAAQSVVALREARVSERDRDRELNDFYIDLFSQMSDKSRPESGLGFCLLPAEKVLLARYASMGTSGSAAGAIPGDTRRRLARILLQDPTEAATFALYSGILENYDSEGISELCSELKNYAGQFLLPIEKRIETSPAEILDGIIEGIAPMKICDLASRKLGLASYTEILEQFGLTKEMKLYRECVQLFVVVCGAEEYRQIGESKLFEIAESFDPELRTRLLRNMLVNLDSFQLRGFTSLLDIFKELAGDRGTASFEGTLGGLEAKAIDRYDVWLSQYKIRELLGTGERADFWMGYAGKVSVILLAQQEALIFDFGKFKTIELKDVDAAYFYDKEYYEKCVRDGISDSKSQEELENFLYNKTEWASQGENLLHWRRAHVRNWQLDMKDYISKNLRK